MQFNCPKCNSFLTSTPELAGQVVSCPDCGVKLRMPSPKVSKPVPIQPVPIQPTQPPAPVYQPQKSATPQPRYQNPYQAKKSSSGNGLKVGLIVAGCCFFLLLAGGGAWFLMSLNAFKAISEELDAKPTAPLVQNDQAKPSVEDTSAAVTPPIDDANSATRESVAKNRPNVDYGYDPVTGELGEFGYSMEVGKSLHYGYDVSTSIEGKQLQWSGTLSLTAQDSMAIREVDYRDEPNYGRMGQGLAIAPNLIVTSRELVSEVEKISVVANGKSVNAKLLGVTKIREIPDVGIALIRTDRPVVDEARFNGQRIGSKDLANNSPLWLVYRDTSGAIKVRETELVGFSSSRHEGGGHSFKYLQLKRFEQGGLPPTGAIVVTKDGEILGVLGHVRDRHMRTDFAIPLPMLDYQGLFKNAGLELPEDTEPSPSVELADMERTYGPALVRVDVKRIPTFEDELAAQLPSQKVSYRIRQKSPSVLGRNAGVLGFFGSSNGEFFRHANGYGRGLRATPLPFTIGNAIELVTPPLSPAMSKSWEVHYPVALVGAEEKSDSPAVNYFARPRLKSTEAGELIRKFSVSRRNGSLVSIRETLTLQTLIGLSFEGSGMHEFDSVDRCMRSGNFKGKLVFQGDRVTLTLPLQFKFHRISDAEMAPRLAREEQARKDREAKVKAEQAAIAKEVTEEDIVSMLADLDDRTQRTNVLRLLSKKKTANRDERLSRKLAEIILQENTAIFAADAAINWMTDEHAAILGSKLSELNVFRKGNVFKVLAGLHVMESVPDIIQEIEESEEMAGARCLWDYSESREIERMILARLKSIFAAKKKRNSNAVKYLIQVLGRTHGAEESEQWLEQVISNNEASGPRVSSSIRKIKDRLKKSN